MKTKKIIILLGIVLVLIQCFNYYVYAESNNKEFKFEKSSYLLRGDHDIKDINFIIPDGYTTKDIEIISEDESVVHILEQFGKYYAESLSVGKTRLKAVIKSTNYVAYCDVIVDELIIINVSKKNVGATLEIDNYCPYIWIDYDRQACEISVTPLNYEGEEKWIRLGEDMFGAALRKKYSYNINENCVVTVRWVNWSQGQYYKGENEVFRKTIVINDLEPISSIGSKIKIFDNNHNENNSLVRLGNTLKLNAQIVEIPDDLPVTWKSYPSEVAMVDSTGLVTAIRKGTARIEASVTNTLADGSTNTYKDIYIIIVEDENQVSIEQSLENNGAAYGIIPEDINIGEEKQAVILNNGLNVAWKSSDNNVVTINKDGLIEGISNGDAVIYADITTSNNKTYKIAQQINVSGEIVENNNDKDKENDKKQDDESKENDNLQKDNAITKQIFPKTGRNTIAVIILGLSILGILFLYAKYRKYKHI